MEGQEPLITNDAIVFGILLAILALVFSTASSQNRILQKFYRVVPTVLLCYFIPAVLNSMGIISGEYSNLYFVASRYFLPASLVLFTLSIDLKGILKLGPKALTMFLAGTLGIMLGGPLALLTVGTFYPEVLGGEGSMEIWRGLATIAGSWIGGGANQTAMLEVFGADADLFAQMIAVDVLVANLWMAFLLYWAAKPEKIDHFFKADTSAIYELRDKIADFRSKIMRIPTLSDSMVILGIAFGITGVSHLLADNLAPYIGENYPQLKDYSLDSTFFWIVVVATTAGLALSFTRARNLEGAGASRYGSVFLYILVATIGMQMDLGAVLDNPILFVIGILWMFFHILIMLLVAWLIKAPFFYVAVGSQANVGGAASAPIVAGAFDASLAPVGVLLAVLGYAVGTYGAYLSGLMMQAVSGM
ncbi:MAG: putative integral membrane protein [Algoriphagus marincola HL-49]|uniref:Putative integral membrane protein n=1 Tax=Algoriphagus marincola HL-49 TaxID=1305737 RepID=A0A0P7YFJ5_9BACT|nr:MAG: putative integral membrane protein [Algoriphagus marincola HL-49]